MAQQIRALGVRPGGICMVHTAFKSLALPDERIADVITALIDALGPEGTLIMPTHAGWDGVYDHDSSPSVTGALTEVFRTQFSSLRSRHPTHSCSALGKMAREAVAGHEQGYAVGTGSPCEFVYEHSGQVLLIGVDLMVATIVHLAEFYVNVAYLCARQRRLRNDDGQCVTRMLTRQPGHSNGFVKLEPLLKQYGHIRYGSIESASCRLFDARGAVDAAVRMLTDDPAALLCDDPNCSNCNESRRLIRVEVNSA
ncbi:MAG: hypothetical protein CMJ21_01195 [Phycisphaerae bacterium]|nr:hypothetical protein [Phycisphaerae bacterium]